MFVPLALPSTLDRRDGVIVEGVGARRPTGGGGPFSHGRGLAVNHRLDQMSITFGRIRATKKGDRLVALVRDLLV